MKNYEMMFIVKTTLEEAAVKNTVKEFSDIIQVWMAKLLTLKKWDKENLLILLIKKLVVSTMYLISKLIMILSTN